MLVILSDKDLSSCQSTRSNGYTYRLSQILSHSNGNIQLLNAYEKVPHDLDTNSIIIDMPGLSIKSFLSICILQKRFINKLFLQDSSLRYMLSYIYFIYRSRLFSYFTFRDIYHLFLFLCREMFFSIFSFKVGFVAYEDLFLPLFFTKKHVVITNGVEVFSSQKSPCLITSKTAKTLIFWGDINYKPNHLSLIHFLKNYWSKLQEAFPFITLDIFGYANPQTVNSIKKHAKNFSNVTLKGSFSRLSDISLNDCIFVNLVEFGSGIKNKTLEAISLNLPMISTYHAACGVKLCKGEILKYDSPSTLIDNLQLIMDGKYECPILADIHSWQFASQQYIDEFNV